MHLTNLGHFERGLTTIARIFQYKLWLYTLMILIPKLSIILIPVIFIYTLLLYNTTKSFKNLKSREIISISGLRLPLHHTEPSASLLFPKGDEPFPAVGKAQLYPNYPAVSASYTLEIKKEGKTVVSIRPEDYPPAEENHEK